MASTINSCVPVSSTVTGNTSSLTRFVVTRTQGNDPLIAGTDTDVQRKPQRSQRKDTIVETNRQDYSLPLSTIQNPTHRSDKMVYRPQTKEKLAKKSKRCAKCGKIVRAAVRCKRCHKVQA